MPKTKRQKIDPLTRYKNLKCQYTIVPFNSRENTYFLNRGHTRNQFIVIKIIKMKHCIFGSLTSINYAFECKKLQVKSLLLSDFIACYIYSLHLILIIFCCLVLLFGRLSVGKKRLKNIGYPPDLSEDFWIMKFKIFRCRKNQKVKLG